MNTNRIARPLVLFHYFRLFAWVGLIPFLINTIDVLLHLNARALNNVTDPVNRGLLGLLVAPLVFLIAVLCIRRVPDNLIGWLLVAFAYGISVEVMRGDLLPVDAAVHISSFFIGNFWFAFLVTPLYFPDGLLYPQHLQRWGNRLVIFIMFSSKIVSNLSNPTNTWGSGSSKLEVPNPFFLIEWEYTLYTIPTMVSLIFAGIVVVILRYRSHLSLARLQLRWFLFAVLCQGGLTVLTFIALPELAKVSSWLTAVYGLLVPIAVGMSILQYRLYDIDLIIRRTMQYGLLSLLLGLLYFGMVVLLGQAFQAFIGQESPLVVVISTLVIAALFTPLRRRIQDAVDRRFYRQKYNAEQALETFSTASSREVELDRITGQLIGLVEQTVQPERVWLWIREGGRLNETEHTISTPSQAKGN